MPATRFKIFFLFLRMRFLFLAAVVLPVFASKSTQLDTIIYQYLPGSDSQNSNLSFCSRRLNQTDQVGCQSERNRGNRGTLIYIGANQTELMSYLTENDKIDSEIGIYLFDTSEVLFRKDFQISIWHNSQFANPWLTKSRNKQTQNCR